VYEGCSKSIRSLAGKNTFTRLEVCNPNSVRSSLLVTEHTSPSGSATVPSISEMPLCEWSTAWPSCSVHCCLMTQIESLSAAFSGGERPKIARSHVGRVGSLSNHRNVVFGQESLNQLRGMSWCVVMMQLPRSAATLRMDKLSVKMGYTEPVLIPTSCKFSNGDTMVLHDQSQHLVNELVISAC
jgi:hypothetical protein